MADAPGKVQLSVDGRTLEAAPGTLLIEACKSAGIEVPSFCYYPGLALQAACRMCLVEIEKTPKLQTACTVVVQPGLGPQDLAPGEPVQLLPGALIDIGDGITIQVTRPE